MGNEECASASFLSLFRPHHRIPLSLSLSRPRSPPGVWTGRFKRIPSVVGSARLAGSSWRHEAATTSAICFEYELTIALVKCHEHVYRCITTRMIRRSDSGFRGSLSVQEAYLRFSRGWNWVNGIGGIIGGTLRMKRVRRPMVSLCFRNWNNWKTARDEVDKLGSFVVGEVFMVSNCFVEMWLGIYQIFHFFWSCSYCFR